MSGGDGFRTRRDAGLPAGRYEMSLVQTLDEKTQAAPLARPSFVFHVADPPTVLTPGEIAARFPVGDARGAFARVVPHIALRNAALPWMATVKGHEAENPPWLALLVVGEDEIASAGRFEQLTEDGQAVLVLDKDTYATVVPPVATIGSLTHVRVTGGVETAVVLSHRLPQRGVQNTAFLVSLEDHLAHAASEGAVRLPVLASWRFHCTAATRTKFAEVMEGLDGAAAPLALPLPTGPDDTPEARVRRRRLGAGYVLVEAVRRTGSLGLCWYRGPLVPGHGGEAVRTGEPGKADCAEALIVTDPETGLDDVTYAAAWELGRLLGLAERRFVDEMMAWRQDSARDHKHRAFDGDLLHLPRRGAAVDRPLPMWFFQDLARLQGVPFDYLVPDARMLPAESLRAALVDPHWVQCLLQGAISLGARSFHAADKETRANLAQVERQAADRIKALALPAGETARHGALLLRSEAMQLWPGLEITLSDGEGQVPRLAGFPAEPLPDVRLDLTERPFGKVHIARPMAAAHYELPPGATSVGPDPSTMATSAPRHGRGHGEGVPLDGENFYPPPPSRLWLSVPLPAVPLAIQFRPVRETAEFTAGRSE